LFYFNGRTRTLDGFHNGSQRRRSPKRYLNLKQNPKSTNKRKTLNLEGTKPRETCSILKILSENSMSLLFPPKFLWVFVGSVVTRENDCRRYRFEEDEVTLP
jgi:hypothetical protein